MSYRKIRKPHLPDGTEEPRKPHRMAAQAGSRQDAADIMRARVKRVRRWKRSARRDEKAPRHIDTALYQALGGQ